MQRSQAGLSEEDDFLGLYLKPQQGMALLERVQASNLGEADRARVSHILRVMLRLPRESLPEPSSPQAPYPQGHAKRQRP